MFELKVDGGFSAAHRLRNYRGRCENLHGHNWRVEVTIEAEKLDKTGMVIDFKILKSKLNEVLKTLDHVYLNSLPYFKKVNPTSENIARFIYEKLSAKRVVVKKVSVGESSGSCASYSKP